MRARLPVLPRAAWACALVAFLNAFTWALVTPPFQVPDEISHLAYAQYLAETAKAPRQVRGRVYSDEQQRTMQAVHFFTIIGRRDSRPPWTEAEQRALDRVERSHPSRRSDGASSTAVNNPPLFYGLQAIPYKLASSGTLLDRLFFMRLLSVVLSTLTVVFIFLFLRELLPSTPWAWSVGALAAAFQPIFGFVSSGVNNDSGLFLASAALFYALARAFRRGLTPPTGAAVGAALGLGLVTKLTLLGLTPAAGLGLLLSIVRAGPERRAQALRGARTAVAVAALPVLIYLALNRLAWDRSVYGAAIGVTPEGFVGRSRSLHTELSYIWQLYLPRLPFQTDLIPGFPPRHLWLNGLVGRFGWLDYGFPRWVYDLALWIFLAVGALAAAGLARRARALFRRWPEALTYLAAVAGLFVLIGASGYSAYVGSPFPFEQARYLLPLLPLYAALVALAARGAGRRFGPAAGALIVVAAIAHGLFAQLLTISRYYG